MRPRCALRYVYCIEQGVLGIHRIAYKLLVNDKAKFAALLMGLTFSVFLMIRMTSMFAEMMKKASATATSTGRGVQGVTTVARNA